MNKKIKSQRSSTNKIHNRLFIFLTVITVTWIVILAIVDFSSILYYTLSSSMGQQAGAEVTSWLTWYLFGLPVAFAWFFGIFLASKRAIMDRFSKKLNKYLSLTLAAGVSLAAAALVTFVSSLVFFALTFAIHF